MTKKRVLWIEDSAYNENTILAAPVHLTGKYDLSVALSASEGTNALRKTIFDAVIVDIRIPPGNDKRWIDIYYELGRSNMAARLGLKLLEVLLSTPPRWPEQFPDSAHDRSRYGVLSVESGIELKDDLARVGVSAYRDKGSGPDPTVLLEIIEEIITRRAPKDYDE